MAALRADVLAELEEEVRVIVVGGGQGGGRAAKGVGAVMKALNRAAKEVINEHFEQEVKEARQRARRAQATATAAAAAAAGDGEAKVPSSPLF